MIPTTRLSIFLIPVIVLFSCTVKEKENENEEPESDGMELAMRQEFRMTKDPLLNIVPRERLDDARQYMYSLMASGNGTSRLTALTWEERGPANVGGRTRAIMIDKRDATGNTVFAGSVSGGIFKTTNFTAITPVWAPVNDQLVNLAITNIVQDAAHPDTMFATTGEGWFNIDAVRGGGIFKSTDGGSTWNLLPSTSGFEYVQDLVIDNNGNLYASLRNLTSSNRGVLRSTDRGGSWTQVLGLPLSGFGTGRAADLEVAANGDIYASLGVISKAEIYKSSFSTNGANTGAAGTWTNITPSFVTNTQRVEIILAPSDAQRVYLLAQDSATSQVLNMYRSTNGGATWTTLTGPAAINNGTNSQAWFNLIGAVDPNNANTLVAGGLHLGKSTDGGDSWTTISSGLIHVDQHALVYDGSSKLLIGNDGGIYYSTNINAATPSFTNRNNGYNATQYYGCDLHPSSGSNYLLAGAQDNGTQKFTGPGVNTTTNATGGDGGTCHIDKDDPNLQVTSNTGNNFNRSTNGGASFSSLGSSINNDRGQFINPTDYDNALNVLYSGDDAGKYFCVTNLSGSPSAFSATVGVIGTREVTAIKVDPFSAKTIWIGASFGTGGFAPAIVKLSNANTNSPSVIVSTTLGVPGGSAISSIDVDPANSNHILATVSSYGVASVWESTNGGTVFNNIEGNLPDMPVRWGMFAPTGAELNGISGGTGGILLATELGVWSTSQINGNATVWMPNNSGLANVRTDMLKYRPSDHTVAAATHGRGLFTTILPGNITDGGGGGPVSSPEFIQYINAEDNRLLIVVGSLQISKITIQVFDMAGRKVYESAGAYQNTTVPLNNLSRGVYSVRCFGDDKEKFTQKFIK